MHKDKANNQSWSGKDFDRHQLLWVKLKMALGIHGKPLSFSILHFELLENVLGKFCLRDKSPLTQLLYLKSKKELQLPHHGHLKPVSHKL